MSNAFIPNKEEIQKLFDANPEIAAKPMAKELMSILESGNTKAGEDLANNLLNSYGATRDNVVQQATSFFTNIMGRVRR